MSFSHSSLLIVAAQQRLYHRQSGVEAFGSERQRVLFGDTDVLEGESFEDHGIEV